MPEAVELVVCTLSVELPEPVIDVGLNVHVVLAGQPVRVRFTVPLKPFTAVTVEV